MVSYNIISKTFDNLFNRYDEELRVKCGRTIKDIQKRLSTYSRDERTELLQGRLTPLEWEDYNHKVEYNKAELEHYHELLENGEIDEEKIPTVKMFIEEIEEINNEELFEYDRRIIENYTLPEYNIPEVDLKEYKSDKNIPYIHLPDPTTRETIEPLEMAQIELQDNNVYLTDKEQNWLSGYFLDEYTYIKERINNPKHYEDSLLEQMSVSEFEYMEKEFPNIKHHLDNAINKTDGLQQATILYHGGPVDLKAVPGYHGVWKSYKSTSFQEISMIGHNNSNPDYWQVVILAPKGTKGICGNGAKWFEGKNNQQLNQYTFEHEYLLGRNTGYTVVSMDYENHRQVVILDEP